MGLDTYGIGTDHVELLANGVQPCFCNDLLRAQKIEGFTDDQAGYISGSLLEAGSDTTAAILYGFILACLLWPDVQRKVQAEIDQVVGNDRLPAIEDYEKMPYVRCCIKEAIRWMPTVILGVPHAAVQEDTYKGWRIPLGATVINNVWAIHMDPKRSPSPRTFDPERFAEDHRSLYESATGEASKRDNYVFGAGRRLCQGIHIAERSLALGVSRLMWAFTFSPSVDEKTGQPVSYDGDDLVGGITVEPRHYTCKIESRSQAKAEIIRKAIKEDAEEFLDPATGQWNRVPKDMAFSTFVEDNVKV
jgi:cytochrome P450